MRSDEYYMWRALSLAKKGQGLVSPNPMVGVVVVSPDGKIIAEGYHKKFGDLHAERVALEKLNYSASGCTLYVNLEPCCHYGKTPPCVEAIVEAKIKRVVVGVLDPNPLVSGRGVEFLRSRNIEVKVGVLEDVCRRLNRGFFKWIKTKRPYVILKWAESMDGKIATESGDSKWISCPVSLRYAHKLRAFCDAVLVGSSTVLKDDPQLTVRRVNGVNPLRVVLDAKLSLPLDRQVFKVPPSTVVFTSSEADVSKVRALEERGVKVERVSRLGDFLDLEEVLVRLGDMGVTSLLVEGGAKVHGSFIREGLWDEIQVVVAPKIVGSGISAVGLPIAEKISDAVSLKVCFFRRLGDDFLFLSCRD